MSAFTLYGVKFTVSNARGAARVIRGFLRGGTQAKIFTPNLKILCAAKDSCEYRQLLGRAELLLPDGAGIALLCYANALPPPSRVTGVDTAFLVLRLAAARGLSVFLLGGRRGVAERAAKNLCRQIPTLRVCGTHHGYFDKSPQSCENKRIIAKIRSAKPDLLFVCLGFPEQEKWICENISSLPSVRLAMGLGGSLDVWSGDSPRAPLPLRVLNLEWLYRGVRKRLFAPARPNRKYQKSSGALPK